MSAEAAPAPVPAEPAPTGVPAQEPSVGNGIDEDVKKIPGGHKYKFDVAMSCEGCSGAIERVLKKLEGLVSFQVSLEQQTAIVVTQPQVEYTTVLGKIKKTGKTVKTGEADGKSMPV